MSYLSILCLFVFALFILGYQHSAFSFGIESHVTQSNINSTVVPPGALVNLLQKGIQFIEGELCVTDVSPFSQSI